MLRWVSRVMVVTLRLISARGEERTTKAARRVVSEAGGFEQPLVDRQPRRIIIPRAVIKKLKASPPPRAGV
jgi:hypothetical protein